MATSLHRLVYRSAGAIPGTAGEVEAELARILAASRRHNAAGGLTGVLLRGQRGFLQVLEGSMPALEDVYDRIAVDLRHTGLELLHLSTIGGRDVADHPMGYLQRDEAEDSAAAASLRGAGGQGTIQAAIHDIAASLRQDAAPPA